MYLQKNIDVNKWNKWRGQSDEHPDLRNVNLQSADLHGINLRNADLTCANLGGVELQNADLSNATLCGTYLRNTDLSNANLCCANLRGAYLPHADLNDAYLRGARLVWQSHDLIAEILRQAAGKNKVYRSVAGLVFMSRDLCWEELAAAVTSKQRDWAFGVLAQWADENTPRVLREWMARQ